MASKEKHTKSISDKRTIITTAVNQLCAWRSVSPKQAREWILQEAMAKKATLDQVAEAVLSHKTVDYHYSAPI